MKLYELTENFLTVSKMIDNSDCDNQVLLDTLESIECAIEVKAQNYVYIDRNYELYSKGLAAEIARLQAKLHVVDTRRETLRNNLFRQLEIAKLTEVKTDIATIKQKNNPSAVEIINEKLIPAKYQTVVPASFSINKSEIKKDLKAKVDVPGAKLTQSKRWEIK